MTIRTQDELEQEWGQERFVSALGALATWYREHGMPQTVEAMRALAEASDDAFCVLNARVWEASEDILKGVKDSNG